MPNQQTVLVVGPDSAWRSSKCRELAAEGFAIGNPLNRPQAAFQLGAGGRAREDALSVV